MVASPRRVDCWSHLRRKFDKAVKAQPKGIKIASAVEGLAYCTKLFMIERERRDLPPDGRLEISNNRAERRIKFFVIGRKNFLFANTSQGAQASAVLYSILETAKANGLNPYRYLFFRI